MLNSVNVFEPSFLYSLGRTLSSIGDWHKLANQLTSLCVLARSRFESRHMSLDLILSIDLSILDWILILFALVLLLFITLANQPAAEVGNVGTVQPLPGLQQVPNEPPAAEGSDRPCEPANRLVYGQSTRVRDRARALSRELNSQNADSSSRTRISGATSANGRGPSGHTEHSSCP